MIPRLLHRYWSGEPRPEFVDEFGVQWERLHPGWEVTTWSDESLPPSVSVIVDSVAGRVRAADAVRHRSNVARYALLHEFGGVWVDCDVRPLRSIEGALDGRPFVASLQGRCEGAVMGGPAGHKFFEELTTGVFTSGRTGTSVFVSGADWLDHVARRHLDVRVCPPAMWFTSYASGKPLLGNSYTEHLWASSRTGVAAMGAR